MKDKNGIELKVGDWVLYHDHYARVARVKVLEHEIYRSGLEVDIALLMVFHPMCHMAGTQKPSSLEKISDNQLDAKLVQKLMLIMLEH